MQKLDYRLSHTFGRVLHSCKTYRIHQYCFRLSHPGRFRRAPVAIMSDEPSLSEPPIDIQYLRQGELLGRGSFGKVYKGTFLGKEVAIKWLLNGRHGVHLLKEATLMAKLRFPGILTFYGVVDDPIKGKSGIVMEWMPNGSLYSALNRHYRNREQKGATVYNNKTKAWLINVSLEVAIGVQFLHMRRVVHCDLKTDNLLCDLRVLEQPKVKIGDMGMSKETRQTLFTGGFGGTTDWMAPELLVSADDNKVTAKVDIYSLGVVLWEIWTMCASSPYGRNQLSSAQYDRIIDGSLRPKMPVDCVASFAALIQQCWHSDPWQRPSAEEVVIRLQAVLQEVTAAAPGP